MESSSNFYEAVYSLESLESFTNSVTAEDKLTDTKGSRIIENSHCTSTEENDPLRPSARIR